MKYVEDISEIDLDIIETINAFAAKMQRGYFKKSILHPQLEIAYTDTDISDACKKRSKRKPPALEEIIQISHELLIKKYHHKDIARKHRMSVGAIAQIKYKLTHNKSFLNDLYAKRKKHELIVASMGQAIELKRSIQDNIYNAKSIICLLP